MPESFHPFSSAHAAVVVTFALYVPALIWLRRWLDRTGKSHVLDRTLALVFALIWIFINVWTLLPWKLDISVSLPLHVCDLVALLVPFVLAFNRRWMRALLYFWGLGTSSQGFITPDLMDGPAKLGFWMFWANHFIVVGTAIYDLAARGFKPDWQDYRAAVIAGFVYLATILPFDLIFGFNYGYLGRSEPHQTTIIDYLGPWPWRVAVLCAGTAVWMALLVVPWTLARRWRRARRPLHEASKAHNSA